MLVVGLVTVEEVVAHSKPLFSGATYGDIYLKLMAASAIVLKHIERPDIDWLTEWRITDSPIQYEIPLDVKGATCLVFGSLNEVREAENANPLSPAVIALLAPYHRPALA